MTMRHGDEAEVPNDQSCCGQKFRSETGILGGGGGDR